MKEHKTYFCIHFHQRANLDSNGLVIE